MPSAARRQGAALSALVMLAIAAVAPLHAECEDDARDRSRSFALDGVDYTVRAWAEPAGEEERARADARVPRTTDALALRAAVTATPQTAQVSFAPHPFALHEVLRTPQGSSYHSGQVGGGALDARTSICVRPGTTRTFERVLRGAVHDYVPRGFRFEAEVSVVIAEGCGSETARKRLVLIALDRRATDATVSIEMPEPYR